MRLELVGLPSFLVSLPVIPEGHLLAFCAINDDITINAHSSRVAC